mgnify:CR=1 FL=1
MNERLVVITLHLLYNLASVYAKADARFEPIFEKIKNVCIKCEVSLYELEQLVSSFENTRLKFLAEKKKLTQTDDIQLAQVAAWALYIAADVYWQVADMYCRLGILLDEYRSKFETIRTDMWCMKNDSISVDAIISAQMELEDTRDKFLDALNEFLTLNNIEEEVCV